MRTSAKRFDTSAQPFDTSGRTGDGSTGRTGDGSRAASTRNRYSPNNCKSNTRSTTHTIASPAMASDAAGIRRWRYSGV